MIAESTTTPMEAAIRTRLQNAKSELQCYRDYNYVVVNDDLESCVHAVQCVIRAARCRTSQVEETVQGILATFEEGASHKS